jgi:hypothetical protein
MEAGSPRRWIESTLACAAIAGVLLAAIAGGAWILYAADREPTTLVVVPPSAPPAAPTSSPEPASAPEAAIVATEAPPAADEVQMCGGEWVKVGADGEVDKEAAEAFTKRAVDATRQATLMAMQASVDQRAQAAAHFFQMSVAVNRAGADKLAQGADFTRTFFEAGPDSHRDALVRLAEDSTDPQVYAWAYHACHRADPRTLGACQLINAEQWARLDPSNAAPWLILAGEADTRHDASGVDDAMYHVASAERLDSGWGRLTSAVVEHAPSDEEHLVGAIGLAVEAIGIDAATSFDYLTGSRYCNAKNEIDANRRETCERVAELFVDRSSTLLEKTIGAGMARRLGWPAERVQAIRKEQAALSGVSIHDAFQLETSHDCADLRGLLGRFRDTGTMGEVASLQRAAAASGKSYEQLATDSRDEANELLKRLQRAQDAASAASAPDGAASVSSQ